MYKKLDNWWFKAEAALCLALLAAMVSSVFLDVVLRQANTPGPLHRFLEPRWGSAFAASASGWLALALTALVLFTALRTASLARRPSLKASAGWALLGTAGLGAAVKLAGWFFPNGLIWSQTFALCCMLWVAFLGASMATYHRAHLTLEIVEFLWKGRLKDNIGRLGSALASAFCATMAVLGVLVVGFHRQVWLESDGSAGTFESFATPKFAVYAILPFTFSTMALRFLASALGSEAPPSEDPVLTAVPTHPDELL